MFRGLEWTKAHPALPLGVERGHRRLQRATFLVLGGFSFSCWGLGAKALWLRLGIPGLGFHGRGLRFRLCWQTRGMRLGRVWGLGCILGVQVLRLVRIFEVVLFQGQKFECF